MNITDIIFRKTFSGGKLRAIVSITLDDCLAIHEIKLIQTDHLFVAMPYRTDSYGISHDIVHPIGIAARHELERAIIGAYKEYISSNETSEIENFTAQNKNASFIMQKTGLFYFLYVEFSVINLCILIQNR